MCDVAAEVSFTFMWENLCKSVNVQNFAHPHTYKIFLMHGARGELRLFLGSHVLARPGLGKYAHMCAPLI